MRSNGDSNKNPRELEREVTEQRREIGETIHALEDKFSSREIYNQAAHYVQDHGREFAESLGNSLKANPLPAVLTGIGLAWMMMGQRTPTQAGASSGARTESLKQKGAELTDKLSSAGDQVSTSSHAIRDKASATGQNLREKAKGARQGISQSMDSARSNFDYYLHEQPLALGAIGIALGALVGASIPNTPTEQKALGDIGERAKNKASEMAEEGYQKASESVSRQTPDTGYQQGHAERQPPPNPQGGQEQAL
ncbi:MAG: DUF3618 domain-containing protein [Cellvibrionaceae bacterium]